MGTASECEKKTYSRWFKKSYTHRRYASKMKEYHDNDGAFTPLSEQELSKKFNQLIADANEINCGKNHKVILTKKIGISVASIAAAILVVSFTIYVQHSSKLNNIVNSSIRQEMKTPILVLGNGDNIALDGNEEKISDSPIEKIEGKKISYLSREKQAAKTDKLVFNTIVVPSCYTYTVLLEDSTEVFLNANSQLRYPVRFMGDTREVFLTGEAYFKVSKDAKPFIVTTSEVSVKVYGTEFNINTDNRSQFETVLVSGVIGLKMNHLDSKEVKMEPNQRFVFNTLNKKSHLDVVNPQNYIAWMDGLFLHDNEKLCVVLDRIAKWYGVEFDYSNIESMNIPISIKLSVETKLDNILSAIENISNTIIIKKNKTTYVIEKR